MKPNRPRTKYSRNKFMQTSERIFQSSYQPVSMTHLQTGSIEQAQSIFLQRYEQNQCRMKSFQTMKKNKSSQVNNAVR